MSRHTHLVGAWPGRSAAHAMETALSRLGPHLCRLSDGETGHRRLWIQPTQEAFRANPDVEANPDSDWSTYSDRPRFRLRAGHRLRPEHVHLGYLYAFEDSYPQFQVLRERYGRPDIPFQVGIPSPYDIALRAFGAQAGAFDGETHRAVEAATAAQIAQIAQAAGRDVVFQFEMIAPILDVSTASAGERESVAARMAGEHARLAAAAPEGTRFGMHLCVGDFNHKAQLHLGDVGPWVALANAIGAAWPDGRSLDYVHAPFAGADIPPTFDADFYAPLADLALPEGVEFVAGFVHESLDLPAHVELLERIERLVGGEVGVAAACGLGRRPDEAQAWDAMDKAVALIGEGDLAAR
jgi:hypothetical protein